MNKKQQSEFKAIKQRLSTIQLVIKKDIKEGRIPSSEDTDQFIAISGEMDSSCQDEWREAMDDYLEHLAQFRTAVADSDLQAVETCFKDLLDCKASGHKLFRKK
ncbi:MAG: GAK system XXXCH domain-containing protein [Deltaproteobacteria bacterium]|nr:GAK system XXXCH domain-containing protein [Deltaproteobacteria bacterium]MBW2659057.1 GAK system XXXCH domain-containing protein [Deltaproteobacteria bacterium]